MMAKVYKLSLWPGRRMGGKKGNGRQRGKRKREKEETLGEARAAYTASDKGMVSAWSEQFVKYNNELGS